MHPPPPPQRSRRAARAGRALALSALAAWTGCAPAEPEPIARNVVLIVADTLRADRLGCYGYPRETSPAIDALARRGTLYEQCRAQGGWTLPSMISMFSGLEVTRRETRLPGTPTLAETARAAGLATAAFLANETIGAEDQGFRRGFDTFVECYGLTARSVADRFRYWLRKRRPRANERGFFAWVHLIDPHDPYEPAPRDDLFDGPRPDLPEVLLRWRGRVEDLRRLSPKGRDDIESAMRRMNDESNRYDGEVRSVDAGVARIVRALRQAGELERTVVIVCADHGEMLREHETHRAIVEGALRSDGRLKGGLQDLFAQGHRAFLYEEVWRTPLLIAGPGFPAGAHRRGLAANLDLYPTICELLGLRTPAQLAGQSLVGAREPEREYVFGFGHGAIAVRDRRGMKLLLEPALAWGGGRGDPPRPRLFDLRDDPGEVRPLERLRPEDVAELGRVVDEWRRHNARPVAQAHSAQALRALRRMGYSDAYPSSTGRGDGSGRPRRADGRHNGQGAPTPAATRNGGALAGQRSR